MDRDDVTTLQVLYPRIYHACHVEHVRARSTPARLSERDAAILAHLAVDGFATATPLARHLGVAPATLSEALARLGSLGYVRARRDPRDERRQRLELTERGREAMTRASVLDARKVHALLARLTADERRRAIDGLALLARAAVAG